MRIIRKSTRVLGGAFILSLTLSAQTFTTLYNFGSQDHDGIKPGSRAILGQQGELYGTTDGGGEFGFGTVYELLPPTSPGGAWTEQVLHSFNDQNGDGEHPSAGLLMGPNGALYGVTMEGALEGSVFELDPPRARIGLLPSSINSRRLIAANHVALWRSAWAGPCTAPWETHSNLALYTA
jgi:uncharacterized repeat protein (TIGR03803 family)